MFASVEVVCKLLCDLNFLRLKEFFIIIFYMIVYILSIITLPLLLYYYSDSFKENEFYYGKALVHLHSLHITSKIMVLQGRVNVNYYELQPDHFCYKSDLRKLLHPDLILEDTRTICLNFIIFKIDEGRNSTF